MTNVTSTNKKYFKSYLRSNKKLFNSKYLSYSVKRIKSFLDSYDQNLDEELDLKILNFDSGDVVNLRGNIFADQYLYLPGLENDILRLNNGSDSITLGFDSFGRFIYGQYLIPLGTQINLGNKKFIVKGLGGALLSVEDIPPGPTYDVVTSSTAVNEGDTVTFTVNTTNVADGTTLYYTVNGDVDENDFTDGTLTGSIVINNNTASFTKTLTNDLTPAGTEGSESFTVNVRVDSITGTIVTVGSEVNVSDTSIISYSVSESTTSLNEGDTVIFTINTEGVTDGTTLYYTIFGTVSANDFTDGTLSGNFVINNNTATVQKTITEDFSIEGLENQENFGFQLRLGSTSGSVAAVSSSISVEDTSFSTYAISASTDSLQEGETVTFTVTTTNVPDGTSLYYTTTSSINVSNDISPLSGSFVITNNIGTFDVTVLEDIYPESDETFGVLIRLGSTSGTIVATSSLITATNTTSYQFTSSSTEVNEDGSVTINVSSQFVPDGSTLYYRVIGAASNLTDVAALTGSFTINNNSGTFDINANQDFEIDNNETISVEILIDSTSGTVIGTVGPITIIDKPFTISIVPQEITKDESTKLSQSVVPFTVTTTDVPDGVTFTAVIVGVSGDITADDFGGSLSYPFTINNNTASFNIPLTRDGKTEGTESFIVNVKNASNTVIATSATVEITDASYIGSRKTNKTFGPILVNRDEGVDADTSDWYTICGLDKLDAGSRVSLFIDTSGSMNRETVRASLNKLITSLQNRNIILDIVENDGEDWITPHDRNL